MKKFLVCGVLMMAMAFALPANAQFAATWNGGCAPTGTALAPGGLLALDLLTGLEYTAGNGTGYIRQDTTLGVFQGVTATAITTGSFTQLTGSGTIKIPFGIFNCPTSHIRVRGKGLYTTGAASVLNLQTVLCTVSGCGSGTVVAPAGCVIVATNQANVLANGQFQFECELTTATTGTAGTLMAHGVGGFNLGATAAGVVLSYFPDTATAVSAAVDLTVSEFIGVQFKFTTSNAGNTATLQQLTVELIN